MAKASRQNRRGRPASAHPHDRRLCRDAGGGARHRRVRLRRPSRRDQRPVGQSHQRLDPGDRQWRLSDGRRHRRGDGRGGSVTVDGSVGVTAALSSPAGVRLSDGASAIGSTAQRLWIDDGGSSVSVDDNGGSLTVDGTVGVSSVPSGPVRFKRRRGRRRRCGRVDAGEAAIGDVAARRDQDSRRADRQHRLRRRHQHHAARRNRAPPPPPPPLSTRATRARARNGLCSRAISRPSPSPTTLRPERAGRRRS